MTRRSVGGPTGEPDDPRSADPAADRAGDRTDPADPPADPAGSAGADSARDLVRDALADARRMSASHRGSGDPRVERRRQRNRQANLRRSAAGYSGSGADARDPQPLGAVMRSLFAERGWDKPVTEAQVFADWAGLVGADLAQHCAPTALRDGELRLTAQSSAWATQIRLMAPTLLGRLAAQLGAGVVTRLQVSGPAAPSWRHGFRSVPGARGPRDTYG